VNYAGASSVNQYFAIAPREALEIIDVFRERKDVTSIGVNGQAVADDNAGIYGIWVASVKSGSPADKAGVQGGDIITKIENLVLSTDGTMSDYCDILRSHEAEDTLAIEVLRYSTEEVLAGQLNGRELEVQFSFAQQVEEETGEQIEEGTAYTDYVEIFNDSEVIKMEVPSEWTDVDGRDWAPDDEVVGPALSAAPDLDGYYETYDTPGVFFAASKVYAQQYDEESFLDSYEHYSACTYDGRYEYDDGLYTGFYDLYTDCDAAKSIIIRLAAVPEDRSFLMYVNVQAVSEADLDALDRILATFQVVGDF
jgi:serine protease Do